MLSQPPGLAEGYESRDQRPHTARASLDMSRHLRDDEFASAYQHRTDRIRLRELPSFPQMGKGNQHPWLPHLTRGATTLVCPLRSPPKTGAWNSFHIEMPQRAWNRLRLFLGLEL